VNIRKRGGGGFCKSSRVDGVDLVDSGLTRSRSVGSRFDGCGHTRAKRGGRFDQARRILIRRPRTRASGRSAAGGERQRWPAEFASDEP
jgi:hypothetical protein